MCHNRRHGNCIYINHNIINEVTENKHIQKIELKCGSIKVANYIKDSLKQSHGLLGQITSSNKRGKIPKCSEHWHSKMSTWHRQGSTLLPLRCLPDLLSLLDKGLDIVTCNAKYYTIKLHNRTSKQILKKNMNM